jgi:hypothetical protein
MTDTFRAVTLAAGVAVAAQLLSGKEITAQTAGGCPSGFTQTGAGIASAADTNLDGLVCVSEPVVSSSGALDTTVVDNTVVPCGCPDSFLRFSASAVFGAQADRNGDGWVCQKVVIVGQPGNTITKMITIDNNKCNQ